MEHTVTPRGFKHAIPVAGTRGGYAKVYESSAASGPHLWLQVLMHDFETAAETEAVVHLDLEAAATLRDQLTFLIDNHYQVV